MNKLPIVSILKHFSKSDLRQLKDFIYSPYFNKRQEMSSFLDFLLQYAPNFVHKKLTMEQAFSYLYPATAFNLKKLTRIHSDFLKLLELFIYHHFEENHLATMQLSLLRFYRKNNLNRFFKKQHKKSLKNQDNYPYKDARYYYYQYKIEEEYSFFQTLNHDDSKGDINLQEKTEMLDVFFLVEKLKQLCLKINRQRVADYDYQLPFLNEILSFLPNSNYFKYTSIKIWYAALLLLLNPSNKSLYFNMKNLFFSEKAIFNNTDQGILFTYLENTSRDAFSNKEDHLNAVFELYRSQLESGVMYIEGLIIPTKFKNIVTVSLALNQLEWTEKFLEENKQKIVPEHQDSENVYFLCKGQLLFKQGKYEEILSTLNNLNHVDIYSKMDARRILLKVYYELEHEDEFENLVGSFRKFLSEKKGIIAEGHIQANRNFINVINLIYRTIRKDKDAINQVLLEIHEIKILPERTWLLEKLNERR